MLAFFFFLFCLNRPWERLLPRVGEKTVVGISKDKLIHETSWGRWRKEE